MQCSSQNYLRKLTFKRLSTNMMIYINMMYLGILRVNKHPLPGFSATHVCVHQVLQNYKLRRKWKFFMLRNSFCFILNSLALFSILSFFSFNPFFKIISICFFFIFQSSYTSFLSCISLAFAFHNRSFYQCNYIIYSILMEFITHYFPLQQGD